MPHRYDGSLQTEVEGYVYDVLGRTVSTLRPYDRSWYMFVELGEQFYAGRGASWGEALEALADDLEAADHAVRGYRGQFAAQVGATTDHAHDADDADTGTHRNVQY